MLLLLASCGDRTGGAVSPAPSGRAVAFAEVTTTSQSGHAGSALIVVGTSDAARATIARLPNAATSGRRVLIAAFQGQQNTGGYTIRITAIERRGDQLVVRATFTSPGPGGIVTQVLTSPAHVVSIDPADASGVREAILVDDTGAERARASTT